jgi:hypothetical protein
MRVKYFRRRPHSRARDDDARRGTHTQIDANVQRPMRRSLPSSSTRRARAPSCDERLSSKQSHAHAHALTDVISRACDAASRFDAHQSEEAHPGARTRGVTIARDDASTTALSGQARVSDARSTFTACDARERAVRDAHEG